MKFYPSQLYPKRKFLPWNTFKLSKASEKYMCLNRIGTFPAHQMSSRSGSPVFRVTANDTQRKKSHLEFKWRSYDLLQKLKLRSCLCSCINCKVHKALQVRLRCVSSWNTVLISRDPSFLLLFWLPEEGQRKASPNTLLSLNVIFVPMAFFNRKIENKNAFRGNCALRFYHEYLSLKRFSKLGTNKQIKQFKKQEIALMWRRTWIPCPSCELSELHFSYSHCQLRAVRLAQGCKPGQERKLQILRDAKAWCLIIQMGWYPPHFHLFNFISKPSSHKGRLNINSGLPRPGRRGSDFWVAAYQMDEAAK